MRKFLSLVLCFSMMSTLCVSVSAKSPTPSNASDSCMKLDDNSYLTAEDLPNGDAKFTIINNNGEILSESYLNRESGVVHTTDSEIGNVVMHIPINNRSHLLQSTMSANPDLTNFVWRGKIRYNFYGNLDYVVGTRSLNIYYDFNYYTGSRYNVAGAYQNITSLASFIASVLVLPAGIASAVAGKVLTNLGIALGATSIFIPDHYLRCNETEIIWLGQMTDFTDVYATIAGNEFVITEEGYASKVYRSGEYWPLDSYSKQNVNFAIRIYWEVLGQDTLEVVGWDDR